VRGTRWALALLFAALAGPAGARADGLPGDEASRRLGLGDVLASVDRHPSLVAADGAARGAREELLAAQGAFDPTLKGFFGGRPLGYYDQLIGGASVSWQPGLGGLEVDAGWRIGVGDFAAYEGKRETLPGGELFVGVSLPLLKDGPMDADRAARLQARAGQDVAAAEREAKALDLRAEAEAAWWRWGAAAQAKRVAEQILELAASREAALRRKIDEGAVAPIDALEARRAVLSRRGKLAEATAKERAAATKLSLYLRHDDGAPRVPAPDQAPDLPEPPPAPRPDPAAAAPEAWARRPEGRIWRAATAAADVAVRLARGQALPRLDLTVGASVDLPRDEDAPSSLADPALDARLDLSFPTLLRAGRGKLGAARAKASQIDAKAGYARDVVVAQVQTLAAELDGAEARLALADESAEVSSALAAAEEARFALGASDLLLVNLREQALAAAREEQALLRAEVFALRAAWRAWVTPDAAAPSP
jgi:cobalt-zinc-cadmium efflux system outer membrane protein